MAQKFLEPTNLAKILPAEQTLGFITINTIEFTPTSPADLESYLEQDWFKGQFAIAFLTNQSQEVEKVYFLDYLDKQAAQDFIISLSTPEEEQYFNTTIYTLSENLYSSFISGYIAIADNADNLKLIIDAASGDSSNLKSNQIYNTVADNLPYNSTIATYWDLEKNQEFILDYLPVYEIIPEELVAPILSTFPAFGASAEATEEGFQVQTYTAVKESIVQEGYYFSFLEKYRADLTNYTPENPIFFWGGLDLHSELSRLTALFEQFHPSAAVIFEAILRGKAQEYFGENTSLEDDIYPLLENEYALAAYQDDGGNRDYLVLIALDDQDEKQIHVDTLKKGFLEQQIYSDPYIQIYTLEDGSTGQEIVADLVEVTSDTMTYEGVEIDVFSLSNDDVLGYMTVFADNFAFATGMPILEHAIDLMKSPDGSLAASPDMEMIDEIMMSADEASFVDLENLRDSEFWGIELFADFNSISSTKNLFNDGIATFHLLKY